MFRTVCEPTRCGACGKPSRPKCHRAVTGVSVRLSVPSLSPLKGFSVEFSVTALAVRSPFPVDSQMIPMDSRRVRAWVANGSPTGRGRLAHGSHKGWDACDPRPRTTTAYRAASGVTSEDSSRATRSGPPVAFPTDFRCGTTGAQPGDGAGDVPGKKQGLGRERPAPAARVISSFGDSLPSRSCIQNPVLPPELLIRSASQHCRVRARNCAPAHVESSRFGINVLDPSNG